MAVITTSYEDLNGTFQTGVEVTTTYEMIDDLTHIGGDIDPNPPEGESWKLVSTAANSLRIFWTWERNLGRLK